MTENAEAGKEAIIEELIGLNPKLAELIAEREKLLQKMDTLVSKSGGSFSSGTSSTRSYPITPMRERREDLNKWQDKHDDVRARLAKLKAEKRQLENALRKKPNAQERPLKRDRKARDDEPQGLRKTLKQVATTTDELDKRAERARKKLQEARQLSNQVGGEAAAAFQKLDDLRQKANLGALNRRKAQIKALSDRVSNSKNKTLDSWYTKREELNASALKKVMEEKSIKKKLEIIKSFKSKKSALKGISLEKDIYSLLDEKRAHSLQKLRDKRNEGNIFNRRAKNS